MYAAITVEPNIFKAPCTVIIPSAVIENWSAIGIPIFKCFIYIVLLTLKSSFLSLNILYFLYVYNKHKILDNPWEITVA